VVGAQLEAPVTAAAAASADHVVTGLEGHRLAHRALPGRDLADVQLATPLLGAELAAPLVLAVPARAAAEPLARAASELGLALIVGEDAARVTPRPPLLLVSLPGAALFDGTEAAERLVALTGADGLVVELDPVGDALASGRAARAEHLTAACAALAPLPVVVREVGSGFDGADTQALQALGVAAVDVGGAGSRPAGDPAFAGWGVTLADAVAEGALMAPGLPLLAGGPLRDGVQAAMCLALGATAAVPRLDAGASDAGAAVAALLHQLRVAVWACGAPSAAALHPGLLR
jgi:isopentenyl-diphosphate delta-isomerase